MLAELGLARTVQVGLDLLLGRGGRPLVHLPPAEDQRERASRAQAAMAFRLYRVLLRRLDPGRALEVARRVIAAGAVAYLGRTLGDIDPRAFSALDPDARARQVQGWLDRFFTATAHMDEVAEDRVAFTVTACALVRLSHAAGHPELAPAFCQGDAQFFASRTPPVHLERTTTLADGGSCCPFRLTLAQADEDA